MIPKLDHLSPVQAHYLEFLQQLQRQPFKGDICPDYANRTVLATDNSVYQILPQGVVYPKSVDDIIILCELLNEPRFHTIVVSPRGGGTGTNGQSLTDGIVVDISKYMNAILEINVEEQWVKVQAGVVKDQLNHALAQYGLFFAPDLSTSNRATIGGMINTDASGQGSCLYGKTRDHVLELQTVLLDGQVMTTKSLSEEEFHCVEETQDRCGLVHRLINSIEQEHKEKIAEIFPPLNRCLTGYDLAHIRDDHGKINLNNILCGSEGTLGFITEAKLNVIPIPKYSALVVVKYNDFDASLRDATQLMQANPTSIETIDSKILNLAMNDFVWSQVESFFQESNTSVQGINLVEFTADDNDLLMAKVEKLTHQLQSSIDQSTGARIGYSIAANKTAVNKLWAMRKRAVGLLGNAEGEARPIPFVEDTAVPPEHLADFILEFREILDAYNLSYGMFGHVDAGVLHVRPALDMKDPEQQKIAWEISDRIAELTQQYHGLLWGEHGKGVRSEYSPQFFGELYPQLQRIKYAFDPHNQMNPGKIATPSEDIALLKIDEVPTRGEMDRGVNSQSWLQYRDAVYCNGNGVCHNWNFNDPMCPSWKATRQRIQTPKGRASLVREWLKLLSQNTKKSADEFYRPNMLRGVLSAPKKIINSIKKNRGEYDFSHEVYQAMEGCLACKSCTGQCPVKVNVPEFRSKFLSLYHTRYLRPMKDYLVGSLEFLLPICAKLPTVYNGVMSLPPIKYCLKKYVGFVDGPLLSKNQIGKAYLLDVNQLDTLSTEQKQKTIVIIQDAFTRFFEAELVLDLIKLCNKLGYNAYLAPYIANGKPLHVHGFLRSFTKIAYKNSQMLSKIAKHNIPMIGLDPSMTLTYRSEYKNYLPNIEIPKVYLIQEWLEQLEIQKEKQDKQTIRLLPHCTERTNATSATQLWKLVFEKFGLTAEILDAGCCGMSGTFGHESKNRETSNKIYLQSWKKLLKKYESSDIAITGFSCRSQVKREDKLQLAHPIQILLKSIE